MSNQGMNNFEIELINLLTDLLQNTPRNISGPTKYSTDEKTVTQYIKIVMDLKENVENISSNSFTTKELILKICDVLIDTFKKKNI